MSPRRNVSPAIRSSVRARWRAGVVAMVALGAMALLPSLPRAQGGNGGSGRTTPAAGALRLDAAAPADTFAYVSFAGLAAADQAVEQLSLWQLWQDPQVQAFFAPLVQRFTAVAEQTPANELEHWQLFQRLFSGRVELIVRGYGLTWDRDEAIPMPGAVLALDLSGHEQEFDQMFRRQLDQLDRMLERARSEGGPRVQGAPQHATFEHGDARIDVLTTPTRPAVDLFTARHGNLFLLGVTRTLFLEVLDNLQGKAAETKRLDAMPAFARARGKVRTAPLVEAWLNLRELGSRLGGLLPDEFRVAAHVLGLDGIDSVYWASTVRDGDSFDTLYVDAPAPRRGLLRCGPEQALDTTALRTVPQTAIWASAFQLDLAQVWDTLWQAFDAVAPPAHAAVARREMARAEQRLGFSIRDGALAAFGRTFTLFADLPQNAMVPSLVVQADVADEGKLRDVFARLAQMTGVEVRDVQHKEQTLHLLSLPQQALSPCYAFVGGKLLFSLTLPGLRGAVTQALERQQGGLAEQETFRRTFTGLDLPGAAAFEYLDVRRLAAWGYGLAENFVPSLAGQDQPLPIDPAQMPPREVVLEYLRGFGAVAHCDQDGVSYRARTFGLATVAALGSAFLRRAPGVPPHTLMRLGQELERGMSGGMRPRRTVVQGEPQLGEDAGAVATPAESRIVNPLPPGDPREAALLEQLQKLNRSLARDPNDGSLYFSRGLLRSQLRQFDAAVADYQQARELGASLATSAYNIACTRSLQGKKDEALEWLGKALEEGFTGWQVLDHDTDLDAVRNDPRFKDLVAKYRR